MRLRVTAMKNSIDNDNADEAIVLSTDPCFKYIQVDQPAQI
jgi:hypothetical protein